ncbi:hypothetical protein [Falsirhodobacter halotolerans]|uniref:hypothetical protein n=1 Tax=Falsirhodobacter halotolerans TaxID=1146892 RepID=UPI001FD32961|nr:hypothetical protein [Falsirhodobacter halotolerans]MCJ8139375.1 hypothetical protein [Falsirhodobacter halotolerans]
MFHVTDSALRTPQASINARRIWRERIVRSLPNFAYYLTVFAGASFLALAVIHITYIGLTRGVPATLEQADRYRGM